MTYQLLFLIRVMYSWAFTTLFSIPPCVSEIFHSKKEFSSQNGFFMFNKSWGKSQPLVFLNLRGGALLQASGHVTESKLVLLTT